MSEIAQVLLPSGDLIWVRLQGAELAVAGERAAGAVDVGLVERITPVAEVLRLPGFTETVRGVVTSVREALDEYRPDSLAETCRPRSPRRPRASWLHRWSTAAHRPADTGAG